MSGVGVECIAMERGACGNGARGDKSSGGSEVPGRLALAAVLAGGGGIGEWRMRGKRHPQR